MSLEDVSAVRRYAECVLSSPRSAARYIERSRKEILQQKRLYNISTSKDGKTISATCEGSHPEDKYKLQIKLEGTEPVIECTCPAKEKEALCKHTLGLLLWRAGNLTEERLKRQTKAVGHLPQHPADASTAIPAAGHHGAGQATASEQATVAYQAAEAPTPPPVACPAATAGKRRLPASFAKRRDEPAAKKGSASQKETPVKPMAVDAASPAKARSKGQVQSKLSFQATPRKERPPTEQALNDVAKTGNHVPHPPLAKRRQPPAPKPHRCSAQDMLDISDGELLQLCRSAIEAATAGAAKEEGSSKPLSSAAAGPVPRPLAAPGQPQPATNSEPIPTQPDGLQSREPELAEELLEQTDTLPRKVAVASTALASAHISRRSDTAEGSGVEDVGRVAASLARAASADLFTHEAGPTSGARDLLLPGQAPAARSMLEELLGDTFHLLANPASKAEEQQASVKEASLLQDPALQAADSSCIPEVAEASASCLSLASVETQPDGIDISVGGEQIARAQAIRTSGKPQLPDSQPGLKLVEQSLVASTLQPVIGSTPSMQQPGQHIAKKLTLREKLRILKESG